MIDNNIKNKIYIIKGDVSRCRTMMLQEFIEIQLRNLYGDKWLGNVVGYARKNSNEAGLKQLIIKAKDKPMELLDRTCMDITIASALMIYNFYYVISVPRHKISTKDMIDILDKYKYNYDEKEVEKSLDCLLAKNILVIKDCQNKYSGRNEKTKKDDILFKIRNDSFYKLVDKFRVDKNILDSHLSEVDNMLMMNSLCSQSIQHIKDFLTYLSATWEYEDKDNFIEKYRAEIGVCEKNLFAGDYKDDSEISYRRAFGLLDEKDSIDQAFRMFADIASRDNDAKAYIMMAFMSKYGLVKGDTDKYLLKVNELAYDKTVHTDNIYDMLINNIYVGLVESNCEAYEKATLLAIKIRNIMLTKLCGKLSYNGEMNKGYKIYQVFEKSVNKDNIEKVVLLLEQKLGI